MMNPTLMDTTGGDYSTNNMLYPYPYVYPTWYPSTTTIAWSSWDEQRIAALEARLAKAVRDNKWLRRRLYGRQRLQRFATVKR